MVDLSQALYFYSIDTVAASQRSVSFPSAEPKEPKEIAHMPVCMQSGFLNQLNNQQALRKM